MKLTNEKEVQEFIRDRANAASMLRQALAVRTSTDEGYYEGAQWDRSRQSRFITTTTGRVPININADNAQLRVTQNETCQLIVKATAATFPQALEAQVDPGVRDSGVPASVRSDILADAIQLFAEKSGLLETARDVNARRSIYGVMGIGLHMRVKGRDVPMDGSTIQLDDRTVTAFEAHPLRFILDPSNQNRDLRRHPEVIFSDVWTVHKLRRTFPSLKFNDNDLMTIGQLTPFEQDINQRTGLFSIYRQYANTKGARIYQVHIKDDYGPLYGTMFAVVELKPGEMTVVNMNDPQSPFGGDKLPFVLLHGHRRASSMWSIGDVAMLKDDQDLLNLSMTWIMRHAQKASGYQWVAQRRWFGKDVSDEDISHKFHNTIAGVIIGDDPRPSRDAASPPQLQQAPGPQPFLNDLSLSAQERMQAKTFRTELNSGRGLKSHVADQTFDRLINQSDQVLGIRVQEDILAYQQIAMVLLGTIVGNVQAASPSTLAALDEAGYDDQDRMVLLTTDPAYPACSITVTESSIRYRSLMEKRADLNDALAAQALSPDAYREAMAELSVAVTPKDKHMQQQLSKLVATLVEGQPWEPIPLGEFGSWCLSLMRQALLDRRVRKQPQIRQMIVQAIQAQTLMNTQEAMAANPETQLAREQATMGSGSPEQAPQPVVEPPSTVDDLLARLMQPDGQGGNPSGQPAPEPAMA